MAEDHQTKNAKALVDQCCSRIGKGCRSEGGKLIDSYIELINNQGRQKYLSENIKALAKPNAAEEIVDEIVKLIA